MDALSSRAACAECGAPQVDGASCRECFDGLLAFEHQQPAAFGAVHHLTVATYFLQHPRGYTAEVLRAWHALLADALDGRATIAELRRRHGRQFGGAARVRSSRPDVPAGWPADWPSHVRDVFDPRAPLPSVNDYVARAGRWAADVRATLDATFGVNAAPPPGVRKSPS